MKEWEAWFVNNPDDDFNLVMEICNNKNEIIGEIYRDHNNEKFFKIYKTSEEINIPIKFLNKLLKNIDKKLV